MITLYIQDNNSNTKSYMTTDQVSSPCYIKLSQNVLIPVTQTNTLNPLDLNLNINNQIYRPLNYTTASSSDTYYTSYANSAGLSSTTALTRSSTSSTEYLTRSSTSNTRYLTQSSTSATSYLTRSSTSGESYLTKYGTDVTWSYTYSGVDSYMYAGSHTFSLHSVSTGVLKSTYEWTYSQWSAGGYVTLTRTYTVTFNSSSTRINNTQYYYAITYSNPNVPLSAGSFYKSNTQSNNTAYTSTNSYSATETGVVWLYSDTYSRHFIGVYSSEQTSGMNISWSSSYRSYSDYGYTYVNSYYTQGYVAQTTGTSYLTRSSTSSTIYYTRSSTYSTIYDTRSSTYDTVYHTRSSTSGYSGVTSSSTSTTTWA